jgi:hypothetical protein
MTLDDIKTIGIVGVGQMGRGISQVCATAGYQVLLVDVAEPPLMDMDQLFADMPPDQVTTSMTSHGPAAVILARYLAVVETRGISVEPLGGTLQNDILKEYLARKHGSSHRNPHGSSSLTLSPTVRNRFLRGIRSASVGRGLSWSKAVEPRETCGVTGR